MKEALSLYVQARFIVQPKIFGFAISTEVDTEQRKAFDYTALGFQYMLFPPEYVKEELKRVGSWENYVKIWRIVESDYDLRKLKNEFLHTYETQYMEGLEAIKQWKDQLQQITS